jgi:hypothetical protein
VLHDDQLALFFNKNDKSFGLFKKNVLFSPCSVKSSVWSLMLGEFILLFDQKNNALYFCILGLAHNLFIFPKLFL